jgi:hypothetical protein
MKNHIFVDSIVNVFGSKEAQNSFEYKKEIKNGDKVLVMTPITEMTHYLRNKFNNHTLLGSADSRNFYAFDTNEGILLVYPPIPFSTKPALQASFVAYYENKKEVVNEFLPKKYDPQYNYQYHKEKYAKILKNIEKIAPNNDDSNNIKNVIGRIESLRKSNAPIIFNKNKPNLK